MRARATGWVRIGFDGRQDFCNPVGFVQGGIDGWVRIGFDGKKDFCNPAGFVQGGILSAMLDDTMGPAVFVMTEGRLYTATVTMTVNFLAPAKTGADHRRGDRDPARQDHRLRRGTADGGGRHVAGDRHDQRAAGRDREGDTIRLTPPCAARSAAWR